jgi:hypothetical protein
MLPATSCRHAEFSDLRIASPRGHKHLRCGGVDEGCIGIRQPHGERRVGAQNAHLQLTLDPIIAKFHVITACVRQTTRQNCQASATFQATMCLNESRVMPLKIGKYESSAFMSVSSEYAFQFFALAGFVSRTLQKLNKHLKSVWVAMVHDSSMEWRLHGDNML